MKNIYQTKKRFTEIGQGKISRVKRGQSFWDVQTTLNTDSVHHKSIWETRRIRNSQLTNEKKKTQ